MGAAGQAVFFGTLSLTAALLIFGYGRRSRQKKLAQSSSHASAAVQPAETQLFKQQSSQLRNASPIHSRINMNFSLAG